MLKYVKERIWKSVEFRARHFTRMAEETEVPRELERLGFADGLKAATYTTRRELSTLYRIASTLPAKAQLAELGSFAGASTCYLAAAVMNRGGHIYCVDTWQNDAMVLEGNRDTFQEFSRNTFPAKENITCVRKRTDQLTTGDLPVGLDFVFIDADHSYDAVKRDFESMVPYLKEQSIIAFHDMGNFEGVTRFFGELLATCEWKPLGLCDTLVWIQRISRPMMK